MENSKGNIINHNESKTFGDGSESFNQDQTLSQIPGADEDQGRADVGGEYAAALRACTSYDGSQGKEALEDGDG